MPTKPTDLPPPWGTAGNYPATNYPATLPDLSGQANPLVGPTPWSGKPRLNAAALASYAATGFEPQVPNDPSPFNEWLRRVQALVEWVSLGTSAPDADAHVVESDGAGIVSAQKFDAAVGYCNAGITSAVMLAGATIPNGENLDLVGSATIAGVSTTVATLGYIELLAPAAPPTIRQLSTNAFDQVLWNDGALNLVHYSPNGWVYATGDQEAETGLAAVQLVATTTVAIKGLGLGNVRVIVEGQAQVSALGTTFDVDVQENKTTNPAYTDIGAAQQIKGLKDTSDANDWQPFRHERVFNCGITTSTLYRCKVTKNGGGTLKVKEVRLRVVGERA